MTNEQKRNLGLLILRAGVGAMFIIVHGLPKLMGGPQLWTKVGASMTKFGITFAPTAWGFAATITELGGGFLLILGLFTRYVSLGLTGVMAVAAMSYFPTDNWLRTASHPIELGFVFLGLALIGAGGYSLDARLRKKA